jgi:hypothetical protein
MTDSRNIRAGETYVIDALPHNEMNNNGKLEWVDDSTLALTYDGYLMEFEFHSVKCTDVYKITDDDTLVEVSE